MQLTDLKAPYLTDAQIERQAQYLLNSYEASYGTIETPHTPIEDILERSLELTLEVDDFTRGKYFGEVGEKVLGFIDIRHKAVFINRLIDPMENPEANQGRFHFTLGHEAGHFVLHSEFFEDFYAQTDFFSNSNNARPAILCRHPDDDPTPLRPFIEQHADKFAAAILMPQQKVTMAWEAHFGSSRPISDRELAISTGGRAALLDTRKAVNEAIKPLAEQFQVSKTAMRIRLEKMGLLTDGLQPAFL